MRAVLYCARQAEPHAEPQRWASLADARDAALVIPCNSRCDGVHVIAWSEQGRPHAEIVDTHRRTYSRQRELARLYPRLPCRPPPERWPTPSVLNPPQKDCLMTAPHHLPPQQRCAPCALAGQHTFAVAAIGGITYCQTHLQQAQGEAVAEVTDRQQRLASGRYGTPVPQFMSDVADRHLAVADLLEGRNANRERSGRGADIDPAVIAGHRTAGRLLTEALDQQADDIDRATFGPNSSRAHGAVTTDVPRWSDISEPEPD